jgi:AraC-like DNA-binding protein
MNIHISKPSPVLTRYVKQFWAMENTLPVGVKHIQRIVPSGLTDLIFYLKDRPESSRKNNPITENTLISGQINGYYDLKITGALSLFSIIFQPCGLSAFFNLPLSELVDHNVPLRYLLKNEVTELEEKLVEAPTFQEKTIIAENFLLQRLRKNKKKYKLGRIEDSIRLINQTRGRIEIETLASNACYSRKQFERNFSELIGIAPKKFLRIVRFQNAINEKSKNPETNFTELTYLCGYYDQSHMTNDFSKLSGMTPKQYFAGCEPYSDYFQ